MSMVVIEGGVKVELLHHTTAALLGDKVGIDKCSGRLAHFRYSSYIIIYPPSLEMNLDDAHFSPWIRFGQVRSRSGIIDPAPDPRPYPTFFLRKNL